MKRLLVLGIAFSLSSCIAPMTRQEELNVYRTRCLDYGFQWGTPEFAKCVKDQEYQEEKLSIERSKARALENQARIQRQPVFYANHQKVKQKVRSTSHVQQTHIQHTYTPPPVVVHNHPSQVVTQTVNPPPKQVSVQTQTFESVFQAQPSIKPTPAEIQVQTQSVKNVDTSDSEKLSAPGPAEQELQRQQQLEKEHRDDEERQVEGARKAEQELHQQQQLEQQRREEEESQHLVEEARRVEEARQQQQQLEQQRREDEERQRLAAEEARKAEGVPYDPDNNNAVKEATETKHKAEKTEPL